MERCTCVERARLLAGGECDRLVLLFPLHQKTKPFSPRRALIVAVMLSSSPGVRVFFHCKGLQQSSSLLTKRQIGNWFTISNIESFYNTKPCVAQQITKTKNLNET